MSFTEDDGVVEASHHLKSVAEITTSFGLTDAVVNGSVSGDVWSEQVLTGLDILCYCEVELVVVHGFLVVGQIEVGIAEL